MLVTMLKYLSGWLSLLAYKRTLLHWSLAIVTPLMKIPKGKKTKGKKKGALFYFHKILLAKPTMIPTSYIPLPLFPWSCNITNRKPRTCLLKTHFSVMDFIFVHREAFYKHDPFWWLFKLLYKEKHFHLNSINFTIAQFATQPRAKERFSSSLLQPPNHFSRLHPHQRAFLLSPFLLLFPLVLSPMHVQRSPKLFTYAHLC
jgi:hypothetical protein